MDLRAATPARPARLDFRSGGWLLLLVLVVVVGVPAVRLAFLWGQLDTPAVGDGKDVESYGFLLTPLRVERELLYPVGRSMPRDGLPVLDDPPAVPGRELPPGGKLADVRKMTSDTRVIGVSLGGEARAYPIWIMNWHELVNDTLAGVPILVTYNGPCDAVVVFERAGAVSDGVTARFGFSGLLYNGNLVFYDRAPEDAPDRTPGGAADAADGAAESRPGAGPEEHVASLWSQLQMRAIAGPAAAAGRTLRVLPAWVGPWSEWLARHPDTTVILPQAGRQRLYRREPYQTYFANDHINFRVEPRPAAGDGPFRLKQPIVALRSAGGPWRVQAATDANPEATPGEERVYALWFAWNAHWGVDGLRAAH